MLATQRNRLSATTHREAISTNDHQVLSCLLAKVFLQLRENVFEEHIEVCGDHFRSCFLVRLPPAYNFDVVVACLLISGVAAVIVGVLV